MQGSYKEPKLSNTWREVKVWFILKAHVNHKHCKAALHCYTYLKERRCKKRNKQSEAEGCRPSHANTITLLWQKHCGCAACSMRALRVMCVLTASVLSLRSRFRCKVCPLTFFSKSDMQIHSKTHTEAKAHKCPHCTKSFANASYLAQHLRIHLGVKPYRCSYCEKCFRQLSHLQQHTRSDHTYSVVTKSCYEISSSLCLCLKLLLRDRFHAMRRRPDSISWKREFTCTLLFLYYSQYDSVYQSCKRSVQFGYSESNIFTIKPWEMCRYHSGFRSIIFDVCTARSHLHWGFASSGLLLCVQGFVRDAIEKPTFSSDGRTHLL